MPWRGPRYPGEFPSLGWSIGEQIEEHCVIPDGDRKGEPFLLADWQWQFLVWHYRLKLTAVPDRWRSAWQYRRSQLVRPQKCGKNPLGAAMVCAEAEFDVVFDGWDADGEPVGRPWPTPIIQVAAASEGQTDNTWDALVPMIEQGPLADVITDTGLTRINLARGGKIEPVTSSARSRLGQRITFGLFDETHSWLPSNQGIWLADTLRRNLSGTGGRAVEISNAYDPAERSVAQLTQEWAAGHDDVHVDHVKAPANLSFGNKRERRKIFRIVYGDSAADRGGWVDLDRIDGDAMELMARDPAQAERFYGNRVVAGARQWITPELWEQQKRSDLGLVDGDDIALGFDGSISDDNTALVACRMSDGLLVPLRVWAKPAGEDGQLWEVPRDEVHQQVMDAFTRFNVCLLYGDPHEWRSELGAWAHEYGGRDERVREFSTNSLTTVGPAVDQFRTDTVTGALIHNGDPVLAEHVANARTSKRGRWTVITKDSESSPLKIDAAMAAVIAYAARNFAVEHGLTGGKSRSNYVWVA